MKWHQTEFLGVFLTPSPALTIPSPARVNPFLLNKLPNKLAPNVPSNIHTK